MLKPPPPLVTGVDEFVEFSFCCCAAMTGVEGGDVVGTKVGSGT
jgi:hypothetical protein